ncbi:MULTISPECIES: winged helix-turn-helix domain-containing protein [Arthrobacter]|uniref:Winged helix-turn-helix domain-containing protein n=1 Tax=Arthrobacter caoxuetaonis TaxID=2886935 RepID=A0A9X1SCN4_9MICC|nr:MULTISPECIES: winged helix-turn-helix domain-containing protein [Arthrobacter]MCC3283226.1 winged helix-turn-helix domain-containing protein [Arthrobacter caoxuetaonis]MCC3298348.1 winged helix-turn-helix domain-containing protein [Arthrobacter caoxuetaonis]MCC9195107.1 winged helix-turn-helix domain-containing protein [Arthrobacter sp. zg-Y916]USQ57635.1 winged helix-turn-helix domain-containing protein [Arthrobacter caoxuetaonis]
MSVASGYVHISLRNAQTRSAGMPQRQAAPGFRPFGAPGALQQFPGQVIPTGARPMGAISPDGLPMTAPTPVVAPSGIPGPQPVASDTVARGFVIYVGLDEDTAAANGTTLTKLAQEMRAHVQTLVPGAQSHAAVALAPVGASGTDIDVVRQALGDPTVNRRQRQETTAPAPIQPSAPRPSGVLIDLSRREVHLDGETLNLTFKEFELLNYLVENASRTVGREELLSGLWRNAEEVPNERTIDVHIRRLRSKLGRLANTVRTVRGQGYRFYEHPEVVVWAAPEYSI